VRNGTVRSFDGGVAIEGGGNNTVTKIAARDNIGVVGSTRYDDGIAILSSSNNRVIGNLAVHNGPLSGIAIYSRVDVEHQRATSGASTGNLIDMNRVVDTNLARSPSINDSDGIRIETLSVFNTISNNSVTGSGLDGISLFSFAPDNVVRHNVSTNNGFLNPAARRGDGIRVFGGSDRSTVEDNIVTGNAANGIILHGQFNARPPVMDSRVVNNYAVDNNRLPPIGPGPLGGPTFDIQDGSPTCDNNVWFGNTFHTASPACTTAGGHPV
jgi:parallel beta-helix repeat protein